MLRQVLKFLLGLAVAAIAVIVVRDYVFAIYTVPSNINPVLKKGDRVMVNKLATAPYRTGDLMVFTAQPKQQKDTPALVGQIIAQPGDTITVGHQRFRIPMICCRKCGCTDCKLFLINVGSHYVLVHQHQAIGHARRLFNLPF